MYDICALFAGLGDLKSELTMLGRYMLNVLDDETQLLQIASKAPAELSERLNTATRRCLTGSIANWLIGCGAGSRRSARKTRQPSPK